MLKCISRHDRVTRESRGGVRGVDAMLTFEADAFAFVVCIPDVLVAVSPFSFVVATHRQSLPSRQR